MDGHPIRGMILIVVFMIINAVTEAMVTAFETVSEVLLEKRAEEGDRKAKNVLKMVLRHRRYITVTDIIRISCIAAITFVFFGCVLPVPVRNVTEHGDLLKWMVIVACSLLQLMIVELFSIKLPKKLAFKHAEKFSEATFPLLSMDIILLAPIAIILERTTSLILKFFKVKASELEEKVTEEEIISSVTEAQENGEIEAEEAEMINNIFEFDDTEVNEVMTHRRDIVAVNAKDTLEEAMNFMLNESYSRFPVYEGSVENIVGVLHLKDVILKYKNDKSEKAKSIPVKSIARDPFFVPDTQSLNVLFKEMQKKKIHMAVVIDEYGQTAGIVTMEDILEEIVGEIQDEYDDEEEDIIEEEEGVFLVQGMSPLDEVSEKTGMPVTTENIDTFSGLVISELDHIPQDDEKISIEYNGYLIETLQVKNKTVALAKVTRLASENEKADDAEEKAE